MPPLATLHSQCASGAVSRVEAMSASPVVTAGTVQMRSSSHRRDSSTSLEGRSMQGDAFLCRCQAGSAAFAAGLRECLSPGAITAAIHPRITMAGAAHGGRLKKVPEQIHSPHLSRDLHSLVALVAHAWPLSWSRFAERVRGSPTFRAHSQCYSWPGRNVPFFLCNVLGMN